MAKIVDQFSDPGFQVLNQRLQQFPAVDPFIKEAELNVEENEKLSEHAFAWPERRMFRIDSPSQAALSRLYMEKQASVPKEVVDRCDKVLALYGVEMPLLEKKASVVEEDDSAYLLPDIRRYHVKTAEDVDMAIEALRMNHRRLPVDTKARAFVGLAKKAAEFNIPLPMDFLKFAGVTMCDGQVLRDCLEARSSTTQDQDIADGYQKLAEEIGRFPQVIGDRNSLVKVAGVIQELDEAAGLTPRYNKTLPDPLLTVFNMDKVADEVMDLAGAQVPLETLLSIPADAYRDVLGEDLAGEFIDPAGNIDPEKLQVVLPTVPRDLMRVLTKQLGL